MAKPSPLTPPVPGQQDGPRCGIAAVPFTCGELVQGVLDGAPCLVSCPIDHYSAARVTLLPGGAADLAPCRPKATAAIIAGLRHFGLPDALGVRLRIQSPLPTGRGYGSSTADIAAALYALAVATDRVLASRDLASLAVAIEPTDSSPFPGLVLFDHRTGSRLELLGPAPSLDIVVLDPGGEVDTQRYNRVNRTYAQMQLRSQHDTAFALVCSGVQRHDLESLGAGATLSAEVHQLLLHNPLLDTTLSLARHVNAVGVCRAHSGTLLGLMLDPARDDVADVAGFVRRRMPGGVSMSVSRLVDGGPRYIMPDLVLCPYQAPTPNDQPEQ